MPLQSSANPDILFQTSINSSGPSANIRLEAYRLMGGEKVFFPAFDYIIQTDNILAGPSALATMAVAITAAMQTFINTQNI